MTRQQIQNDLDAEYIRAGRMGDIGGSEYQADLRRRYATSGVATPQEQAHVLHDDAQDVDKRRQGVIGGIRDRYKADPSLRPHYGGSQMNREVLDALKAQGLHTEEDARTYGRGTHQGALGSVIRGAEVAGILGGFGQGAHGGAEAGKALGSVAEGLNRAVAGALGGFTRVGESVLAAVLSPFGRTGQGAAKAAGALGQALTASLAAGGTLVAVGVKMAGGLVGGLVGAVSVAIPTALGAALGSVLPGVGTLLGASLGAGLGGALMGLVGSVLGAVGGAVGKALASVGTAFGQLGTSISGVLGDIQGILQDLIQTGTQFATSTLAISRGGGLSLGASSQYAGLGQILTGNPNGLSSLFNNFGTMSPYLASRAAAFGVGGVNPNDPASLIGGAYRRYQGYGSGPEGVVQRQILLQGLFPGASQQIGGLFSMGGGAVNMALSAAKQTAMSPAETLRDARLSLDLSVIQMHLDRLKTKFLTDLMPAIQVGLSLVTKFLAANETKIVSGLEAAGRWMYVRLPSLIEAGVKGFVKLGDTLIGLVPTAVLLSNALYKGFAMVVNGVRQAVLAVLGLIPGVGGRLETAAGKALPRLDPKADEAPLAAILWQSQRAKNSLDQGGAKFGQWWRGLGLGAGAEGQRAKTFAAYLNAAHHQQKLEVNVNLTQHDNPSALYRYKAEITAHMGEQAVRAIQRAGAG